ncbi:restriction endonuclease subunit S [Citrobacter freundii]|nr:restriction endonuclease subunit S [Citrobacter freundii]
MNKLPDGWVTVPLGKLLTAIVGGGTPSKANPDYFQGPIPFMTVKDMHGRFISDTQDHITEQALEFSASNLIPADTLVIASRMSLGKIVRPLVPVAINQDLKALFLHEGINKTYIEYAWRDKEALIQSMGTGTTVKGIRLEDIRGLKLSIAPSSEQTRIANLLGKVRTSS